MNARKKIVLEKLVDYFIQEGKILTRHEYYKASNTPVRPILIPRIVGPWTRLETLIKNGFPEKYALIAVPEEEPDELSERGSDEESEGEPKEEKPAVVFPKGSKE